jgi:hypothetical protein
MRVSQFRRAVADEFGEQYGAVLTHDLVLEDLGSRSAEDALEAGVPAREVWLALVKSQDVPEERWHGVGLPTPPER